MLLDNLGERYSMLPSQILDQADTLDLHVYDTAMSYAKHLQDKKDKKPGVLVETISGEGYSIPVVVLPGNLSDDSIDKLAGYRD